MASQCITFPQFFYWIKWKKDKKSKKKKFILSNTKHIYSFYMLKRKKKKKKKKKSSNKNFKTKTTNTTKIGGRKWWEPKLVTGRHTNKKCHTGVDDYFTYIFKDEHSDKASVFSLFNFSTWPLYCSTWLVTSASNDSRSSNCRFICSTVSSLRIALCFKTLQAF